MSTVLTDKRVTCRQQHLCSWCGELIQKGEKAHYQTGIFDGEFYSSRTHIECEEAIRRSPEIFDDGYDPYDQKRGMTYEESHD